MTKDEIVELNSTGSHSVLLYDLDSAFDESRLRPVRISSEEIQDGAIPAVDDYKFDQAYAAFCRSFRLPAVMNSDATRATVMGCVLDISIPEKKADPTLDVKSIFNEMLHRLQNIVIDMQ